MKSSLNFLKKIPFFIWYCLWYLFWPKRQKKTDSIQYQNEDQEPNMQSELILEVLNIMFYSLLIFFKMIVISYSEKTTNVLQKL